MTKLAVKRHKKRGTEIQFINPGGGNELRLVRASNVDHVFPCHIHRSYTLGVVTSGTRIFQIDGKDQVITAPDGFVINPYQPHACRQQGVDGHDYRVVSISQELMRRVFLRFTGKSGLPYFPCVRIPADDAHALLQRIINPGLPESEPGDENLVNLLATIMGKYAARQPVDESGRLKDSFVKQASTFIDENAGRQVDLNQLSEMVHVSPFHLNRIFRERIGLPPKAYLLQVRIKQSIRLLLDTRSIAQVAIEMGFSDQSHFTRFFKKNVGVSPGRFLDLNTTGTR